MDYKLWEIMDELSESEFRTASYLGEILSASEKTIRTRIKELNNFLMLNGAEVISKPRYGYYLKIISLEKWTGFLKTRDEKKETIPTDAKERMDYMLAMFLNQRDYIKLEELSDFLYVSTKTLSNELKRVEFILQKFEIILERKPYYGIRAAGHEFNKRCCILQNFLLTSNSFFGIRRQQEETTKMIADILLGLASEYQIRFSETAFQNTVLYIFLSISRMDKGIYIQPQTVAEDVKGKKEIEVAGKLYEKLQIIMDINITEAEIYYTGIYITGKQFIGNTANGGPNFVISEKTDKLVMHILKEIYHTYHIEMRDDLNLRIMLNQHLVPMEIRIKYGIPIENTLLDEVKEKYFFAFTMAQQAAAILTEFCGKAIPEEETACLAMYFALALEEKKSKTKRKKNILLVCVSGKASSQMLLYRFRQEFRDYIETLEVCGMYDFDQYDLSKIDFIFATLPIYKKVSVPIIEIHDFLETGEIMAVRNLLQVGNFDFLHNFFKEKYFFSNLKADTKEEVIHEMCIRIRKQAELPDDFEVSVLKREAFGPTDFGNLTAIPHPCRIMTKETIVAVAVLQEEILWHSHMVRVVILTSLSEEKSDETQKFYELTTKFLMDKAAVLQLVDKPEFMYFETLLREVGIAK